jgi:hypothetical protein
VFATWRRNLGDKGTISTERTRVGSDDYLFQAIAVKEVIASGLCDRAIGQSVQADRAVLSGNIFEIDRLQTGDERIDPDHAKKLLVVDGPKQEVNGT